MERNVAAKTRVVIARGAAANAMWEFVTVPGTGPCLIPLGTYILIQSQRYSLLLASMPLGTDLHAIEHDGQPIGFCNNTNLQ